MSRPLRINCPDAIYHVMNRGLARNKIVTGKSDYRELLRSLSEIHDLWDGLVMELVKKDRV